MKKLFLLILIFCLNLSTVPQNLFGMVPDIDLPESNNGQAVQTTPAVPDISDPLTCSKYSLVERLLDFPIFNGNEIKALEKKIGLRGENYDDQRGKTSLEENFELLYEKLYDDSTHINYGEIEAIFLPYFHLSKLKRNV